VAAAVQPLQVPQGLALQVGETVVTIALELLHQQIVVQVGAVLPL